MQKLFKWFAPIAIVLTLVGTTFANQQAQYFNIDQISPANKQVQTQEFDGQKLYKATFDQLLAYHVALGDPAKRAAWAKEWQNKYAQTGELDTEEGTDRAIREMIWSLGQRFDAYLDAQATEMEKEQNQGNFVGIGVELGFSKFFEPEDIKDPIKGPVISDTKQVEVRDAFKNGPAMLAGMEKGDIFKMVGDTPVKGLTMMEMVELIRGPEGTTVDITMVRNSEDVTFTLKRARVKAEVVKFEDLGDGVSYIKLKNFMSKDVLPDMHKALTRAQKGKSLILDLRNNPGGHLQTAQNVVEMLLAEGTVTELHRRQGDVNVVETVALQKDIKIYLSYTPNTQPQLQANPRSPILIPRDMPIVVLVNGGSASASEIVSGALSYSKRALIVGKTTVGKGVGQAVIPLPYNRTLHVTTFEFRPGGVKMDWAGVAPDQVVEPIKFGENQKEYAKELAIKLAKQKEEKDNRLQEKEKTHKEAFEKARKAYEEKSK